MNNQDFSIMLPQLMDLTSRQLRLLETCLKALKKENESSELLETPTQALVCPHCGGDSIWRWGQRNKMQRYRCKVCKRTFNSLTNTPLAHLHKKELWLKYTECLKAGCSIREAASVCNVDKNTAFLWRHRFLRNASEIKPQRLQVIVEVRELLLRKSLKGQRNIPRKKHKRGNKKAVLPEKERVFVVLARDRYTHTFDEVIEKLSANDLKPLLKKRITHDTLICSDNKSAYRTFAHTNRYRHGYVQLSKGISVKKDIVHLRNVTHYRNMFRWWMLRFHGVATKYLPNYLGWYRELDAFQQQIPARELLLRAKTQRMYTIQPKCPT